MGQALLKEVQNLKEWPHLSGQDQYNHMKFITGIYMIKEDSQIPDIFVTAIFNSFLPNRLKNGISISQKHIHTKAQCGGKPKLSRNEPVMLEDWKLKQPLNMKNSILIKTELYHFFANKKDRLTALHPDISEFMIQRNILRQCGGDLENALKSRTTEQSSAEDIISILEVTTQAKIDSSRINIKSRFNTPWTDSVAKSPTKILIV
ncbi:hypothetical protein O181_006096 [Austropuccinia psidii MF-1]|uniref:Uncharacterized protein n=1 Tax=Austropuccinia psidii MF-1 TaxID=1389203 RepID=A0A9Q3BIJ1_9BASI|nr:hypothetical protein [Austropuccinia psidii MF-1]